MKMFLFARRRDSWKTGLRKSGQKPRPVQLVLEQLESRYCPAPVITNFQAHAEPMVNTKQVELTGSVSDNAAGPFTVTFSGSGVSITTTASGTFDVITSATSLGTVTAVATNNNTQVSGSPVDASIQDGTPSIVNFTASHVMGNMWTFSGQVIDDQSVGGLVVTLGGLPSLQGVTVTTNSQGWFSYTCQLGAGESGTATAQTQDIWGVLSNVAWTVVN
jgi:hypothetical protein